MTTKKTDTKRTRLAKLEGDLSASAGVATVQDYKAVLTARAEGYAEHVADMTIAPALAGWAERMEARYGPTVKVWHQVLPWLEALMVVRYGEAIEHWPDETTNADVGRANDWELGKEEPYAVAQARTMSLEGGS